MKKFLLISLLACVFSWIALGNASASGPRPHVMDEVNARLRALDQIERMRGEALLSKMKFERMARRMEQKQQNTYDITDAAVVFDADLTGGTIDTTATFTITATADGTQFAEFMLAKLDTFTIEDGASNPVAFVYDAVNEIATVTLPATLNTGDTQVLVFKNSGIPGCDPDPFFGMQFCDVSEEIVFFASVDWMPTKVAYTMEDLYSNVSLKLDIKTPADYIAASTCDLDSIETVPGGLIHHFTGHFGETYFGMAYAKYQTFTSLTAAGGKPVTTYIYTGDAPFGQQWADICKDIVDYYIGKYSPYIYNKQDVIQATQALGGGVGPQSATFYYAGALNTDPSEWPSESIFSHEIGHQWWGNMVRLGDNYSPWLNEGFAEYSSRLFGYTIWSAYYQDYLYDFYFHYFQFTVDPSKDVPITGQGIMTADATTYNAITYWKGAQILRMLQWLLGDDAFFAGLSTYAHTYSSDVSTELVDVDKFKAVMADAAGSNLDDFFTAWVYSAGYPVYRYSAQFDETADGHHTARVRVTQAQTGAPVSLPIEVAVWVGDETNARTYRVEFNGTVADQTFDLDAAPRGAAVDYSSWIWGDKIPNLVGDVDASNEVDGIDLIMVAWCQGGQMTSQDHWNYYVQCDFDRDGKVDETELNSLMANFGKKGKIDE